MWIWFYDEEEQEIGFVAVPNDSSLALILQGYISPPRPALWFGLMLRALKEMGYGMPEMPEDMEAAALVYWDRHGVAGFFPLAAMGEEPEDIAELGYVLHQVAQLMIDSPDIWEDVLVNGDGEEEEGGFGCYV